jgi:hypothetical protein
VNATVAVSDKSTSRGDDDSVVNDSAMLNILSFWGEQGEGEKSRKEVHRKVDDQVTWS